MMLTKQQIDTIKDLQLSAIGKKSLVPEQLDLIYTANWFNIWVPKEYGGLEFNLPKGLELLEELAYWDAGLAWTITLCSGANMFVGYMDEEISKEWFKNLKICFGGSGAIGGKAYWDGENYIISGYWKYATGAPHLTHFTLNAEVFDDQNNQILNNGEPLILSFVVPRAEVLIQYDWDSFGLECTASHSFTLNNVMVPKNQSFSLDPDNIVLYSPIFNIPFLPFAELTLLMNYIGMYRRFLDLLEKYVFDKSNNSRDSTSWINSSFKKLDRLKVELLEKSFIFKKMSEEIWENCKKDKLDNNELYELVSKESKLFVAEIRKQIMDIYPLGGIQAAQRENEINIVFRNFFTATQHSLLNRV